MKMILIKQFTEKEYSLDTLIQMFAEKARSSRKMGYIVEFITQEPIYDKEGNIIGVTTNFPARLNIYKLE